MWRNHFAGLAPADVMRLKALELEDAKLKRLLADRDLEFGLMREVNRKKDGEPTGAPRIGALPAETRPPATVYLWAAVRRTLDLGVSAATAGVGRAGVVAMHRLSAQYPRYGYRQTRIFLRRGGLPMGVNRARRLWRQAGQGLPRRQPRRRLAASRPRPLPPRTADHVWAYNFVFDACANGELLKCLTVVDEFTHECLAIDGAENIRSGRVIEVLGRLMRNNGAPAYIRANRSPEFVSHAILQWLTEAHIETAIIDPGKLWQSGTNRLLKSAEKLMSDGVSRQMRSASAIGWIAD